MSDVSDVQALENSLARQEELVAYIEKKKKKKKLVSFNISQHCVMQISLVGSGECFFHISVPLRILNAVFLVGEIFLVLCMLLRIVVLIRVAMVI